MNKKTILLLIVATALVLVGGLLFCVAMAGLNWDFTRLSTVRYETNEHVIGLPFDHIMIDTDTADIQLVSAETAAVICYEQENGKHSVTVKDGTLFIKIHDDMQWYERIGVNFDTPKITVCIPKGLYDTLRIKGSTGDVTIPSEFQFVSMDITQSTGDVKCQASVSGNMNISTSTGAIHLENMQANAIGLSVSTGKITLRNVSCETNLNVRLSTGDATLTNVSCQNLETTGDTGDLSLHGVVASGNFFIERTTGDVTFDRCDAAQMTIVTDTGDVSGTLLSPKIFLCEADTGRVELPQTNTGGTCRITTDTGDISLDIVK